MPAVWVVTLNVGVLTSRLSSGDDGKSFSDVDQNVFLCLWSLLHLVPLFVSVTEMKLQTNRTESWRAPPVFSIDDLTGTHFFRRRGGWSENGLPVGPGEHAEAHVEHGQVGSCGENDSDESEKHRDKMPVEGLLQYCKTDTHLFQTRPV